MTEHRSPTLSYRSVLIYTQNTTGFQTQFSLILDFYRECLQNKHVELNRFSDNNFLSIPIESLEKKEIDLKVGSRTGIDQDRPVAAFKS